MSLNGWHRPNDYDRRRALSQRVLSLFVYSQAQGSLSGLLHMNVRHRREYSPIFSELAAMLAVAASRRSSYFKFVYMFKNQHVADVTFSVAGCWPPVAGPVAGPCPSFVISRVLKDHVTEYAAAIGQVRPNLARAHNVALRRVAGSNC